MAYGHADRNLALIRGLEVETRKLLEGLDQLTQSSQRGCGRLPAQSGRRFHQDRPETATAAR
jgi:hypothetical protein